MRQRLTAAAVLLLIPSLTYGAGFALFEAGARSFAMGGAFSAVADDPSALFWNPAGIAFQTDKGYQIMAGATLIAPKQDFFGVDPYPGDGYFSTQADKMFVVPHFYFIAPLNESTSFGLSLLSPFGLGTEWPPEYLGRFISKRVDLVTVDFSPNLSFKLSERFAFGLGVDYRVSSIDLTRNVSLIDPFTQQVVDVAQAHIFTEGGGNDGWGWHAGILAKLGGGISLGFTYRSEVEVEYEMHGSFTQFSTGNPQLDGLVAATIPFDRNIPAATKIDFPEAYNVGLAWSNEKWTVAAQYAWMGWDVFQQLDLIFNENPEFNESVPQNFEDSDKYQAGLEYRANPRWAFQLGYEYDNTPQPREVMSPLLGDADRTVYAVGLSWKRKKIWIDVAYEYIEVETRGTEGNSVLGYDGRYEHSASLAAASLGFLF